MRLPSPFSKLLLTVLASLVVGNAVFGQQKPVKIPDGMERVTSVEGITEYRINSNGLRVLLFPDQSKPTITVNITYLVGSRHEGYGETGMAHLLEHMVFKGTPRHPNIPQELTEHGARPNGTTWYDRTNYFETFSASEENLRWALDLEADRMVNSYVAKKDLESEMTVVRNEFESGENDPSGVLMERVLSTAYLWHNYGKSTIGARADIENVPIEALQAFYRKYYQPDNAVLLVAGKIDEEKTLQMIKEYFGVIPKPERQLIPTYTAEPTQDGERFVVLKRVGDVQVVSCAYHICAGMHPDFAAIDVLTEILTNEPSGRLYKALVETKKASSMWGMAADLAEPGFVYFSADVLKDKSLDDAKATMLKVLDEVATTAPTEEEVNRAKTRLLKNVELLLKNSERVGLTMSEFIAKGDWRLAYLYRDQLEKVTADQVLQAAKTYFKPSNRTTGTFIPEEKSDRVEIPATPNVAMLVKDYKGKAAVSEGEAFDPSPDNIEKRTARGTLGATKYAMLTKETRGDVVVARVTLRFGDEQTLKGKATVSQLTASMLDKGTTKHSRQQIQDELDRLKARVQIFGAGSSVNVSIETERNNLDAVVKLVGEMLKSPAFSADEFEKLKQEELAGIESQRSEPTALANIAFSRILSPYPKDDIRYTPTFDEQVEMLNSVKLDDVKKFYSEFYGASNASVTVVGDFDDKAAQNLVNEQLGSWKSPKKYKRIESKHIDVPAGNEMINTPDKANAMFLAGMNIKMKNDHPDYPALLLGNYMLGGGFLNSRLAVRIRQKEGLSYGVGSSFFAGAQDESAGFRAYAIYAPENVKRLEAAFNEEIEKVVAEGFTAEEIEAAKSGFLQSQQVNRSQDGSLASRLNAYLDYDRTMAWDADLEKKIQALTPEQIHQAMKKYIDPKKMVYVKAGDFERVEKSGKP